jgi:ATP-binding cassette subfamily C protein CydC
MTLAVLLGFATVAAGIGLMSTSAYLISMAALRPSIAELRVAIVGVRFFGISRGLFRYLERLVSHQVTFKLLTEIRLWFYRALEPLAPARLLEYRSGDVLSRVVADIETLDGVYLQVVGPTLVAVLTTLLMGGLLSSFSFKLAAVVLGVFVVSTVAASWLSKTLGVAPARRLVALRSELNAFLVDAVQGVSELLVFDRRLRYRGRIDSIGRRVEDQRQALASARGAGMAVMTLAADFAVVAALLVAVPMVHEGDLDGVYLAVVVLSVLAAFEAAAPLPLAFLQLEESSRAARRLFEIIDAQPAVREPRPGLVPAEASLRVTDLGFTYPSNAEQPALEGVSFDLAEGGRLAIVGPSGAGKSTLVHLLLRFWDYSRGSIRLGGVELNSLSSDDVRQKVSVVSQNSYLFSASVKDNLLLARPSAGEEEIELAARQAGLHEFVKSLPKGYDTWIGEHGMRLSGGERQRLAIARSLLRNAPIVLLDEPSANLDAVSERKLMEDLRALLSGRTTILVTHRFVDLGWVDEVLVLDRGRVVERGTHEGLLEHRGLYRKLYDTGLGEKALESLLAGE